MAILRKLFGKYLLITNTVSCGLTMGAGDLLQQTNEQWKKNNSVKYFPPASYVIAASPEDEQKFLESELTLAGSSVYNPDYSRTKNMMTVGLLQGPFHHFFYLMLDKFFPGRAAKAVIKKTLLDQMIASPTCLMIFFVGLGIMERHNIQEICGELKMKFLDTLKVDCCFWPPTQSVNFLFVPPHYRVLYTNFMTMVYNIFLSYMKYDVQYE